MWYPGVMKLTGKDSIYAVLLWGRGGSQAPPWSYRRNFMPVLPRLCYFVFGFFCRVPSRELWFHSFSTRSIFCPPVGSKIQSHETLQKSSDHILESQFLNLFFLGRGASSSAPPARRPRLQERQGEDNNPSFTASWG